MSTDPIQLFLDKADVPSLRKDLSQLQNVRWLVYNLGIRNRHLDGYADAMKQLAALLATFERVA